MEDSMAADGEDEQEPPPSSNKRSGAGGVSPGDSVKIKPMESRQALHILSQEIRNVLDENRGRFRTFAYAKSVATTAFMASNETALFTWPCLVVALFSGLALALIAEDWWGQFEGLLLLFLTAANVALSLYEEHQKRTELRNRLIHVLNQLERVASDPDLNWGPRNYPHLHTPLSGSVVFQWAYRDQGHKVNLPWALLVKGDVILIKPGQVAPGKCHSLEDGATTVRMEADQALHIETMLEDEISPIPVFKQPARPKVFVMDETPYANVAREVLKAGRGGGGGWENDDDDDEPPRPASLLHKRRHLFFATILTHWITPLAFLLAMVANSLRLWGDWNLYAAASTLKNDLEDEAGGGTHVLNLGTVVIDSLKVILPFLNLVLPASWIVTNYVWLAKILNVFCHSRHVKITDDPFDDTVDKPEDVIKTMEMTTEISCHSLWRHLVSGFAGNGEYLSRTENLVHTLGSVTSLCCTDKKGILSWPNTSAEKIFLLKKAGGGAANSAAPESTAGSRDDVDQEVDVTGGGGEYVFQHRQRLWSTNTNDTASPPPPTTAATDSVNTGGGGAGGLRMSGALDAEILSVTPDHQNPFKVDFDDQSWSQYVEHLKPLGLSILLNTCNISTEEKYTNFYNHLICESTKVTEEATTTTTNEQQHDANDPSGGGGDNQAKQEQQQTVLEGTASVAASHHQTVDMLPIVTRGCLCELPRKLGLTTAATSSRFRLSNQVQTFRRVTADPDADKFAKNLSLAKLKFPFPHMVSVTVQQRTTGGWQLFSQGTADIILDSCTDTWSGNDLEPLNGEVRKKILDFYHRASLSSYCTAFSYRPLTFPIPRRGGKEYLQMPTHSMPFYWQYAEGSECADTDAINTHISLHADAVQQQQMQAAAGVQAHMPPPRTRRADAMACLELQCNQTFLGMVQLQYQPVVDIVQLIDLLEKACIRFVHFSKENELRSRVFSEKMGLETGWNCHISLKSANSPADIRRTVSYQGGGGGDNSKSNKRVSSTSSFGAANQRNKSCGKRHRTASEAERAELKKNTKIGASLPVILDRPAWFLDFPKWQELRCNGDRREGGGYSQMQSKKLLFQQSRDSLMDEGEENNHRSRQTSATSDSDPFEYDMSNRAQLPKGIENIRPHLERMDNVPLLVSLFTDCTPETTKEMISIMQDYGEVVCVMGSSANYHNVPIFLQSDASLAIEPRYSQLCQDVPVFEAPCSSRGEGGEAAALTSIPSPVAVSQLLISVASSLSFKMEDEISIFHLIFESRHFCMQMWNCMQFWTCSLVTLSALSFLAALLMLPPFFTAGQTLYLSMVFVPALSLSLLGANIDTDIMNISTGKNVVSVDAALVKYVFWCYGSRFIPAIAILVLAHLLSVMNYFDGDGDGTSHPTSAAVAYQLLQHSNMLATVVYLTGISLSFIFRGRQIWQKHPKNNLLWFKTVALLLVLQTAYSLVAIYNHQLPSSDNVPAIPFQVWTVWSVGIVLVLGINEMVKRQEIKVEVRHQKRQRLEFGTKLGMNSPF